MTRLRTILTGGALGLAAGAVAIAGWLWLQPAPPAAAPSALPAATARVTRGTLLDTRTVTGTLGYGELSTLRASPGVPAMLTAIAPVGSTVERGGALYALDGQPTLLFYGEVPQHRTLRFDAGDNVPVWVELEEAETALAAAGLTLELEQERLADAQVRAADAAARLADAMSSAPSARPKRGWRASPSSPPPNSRPRSRLPRPRPNSLRRAPASTLRFVACARRSLSPASIR